MARAHPPHIELQLAALFYLQRPIAGAPRLAAALRAVPTDGGNFSPLAAALADAADRALAATPADRPAALETLGLALAAAARDCAPAVEPVTHYRRPPAPRRPAGPGRQTHPQATAWQNRADLA